MADKRISQLVDRGTIANNDVVPIVVSGAVTTNKATISSIQTFMQGNLDFGVTSVGITLGSSGTDVSVSGSPITTSGNITINIPSASATNRGLLSSADWTTFNSKQQAITLTTTGTSGAATLVSGTLNIPNYSTDLSGYVTLNTAQTITAQKTFTTSGSSDTMIISHGSGSGFALDVIKAGSGEAIRVTKTSGSGNAMTISGGNFEAGTIVKTGGTSSQFLMADGSVNTSVLPSGAYLPLAGGTMTGAITTSDTSTNSSIIITSNSIGNGAIHLTKNTSGTGIRITNNGVGEGILAFNNSTGSGISIANISTGKGLIIDNAASAIGDPFVYTLGGAAFVKAKIDYLGNLTANQATLSGALNGTSANFSNLVTITPSGSNPAFQINGNAADNIGSINFFNNAGSTLQSFIFSTPSNLYLATQGNTPIVLATNNAGGGGPRVTIGGNGAVTLTGALNGTTADFSGQVTSQTNFYTAVTSNTLGARTFGGNSFSLRNSTNDDFNIDIFNRTSFAWYNALRFTNSTGAATFSSSVTANSLLVERSASRNMLGISSISLPTSGAEEGVAVIKTNSNLWQMSLVGYAADSKGMRIYNTGGSGNTSLEVATGAGTAFIVNGSGNVGIGTASPAARLEVKQSGSEIPMIIDSSSDAFGAYTQYQVNNSSGWEVGMSKAADGYSYLFSYGSFGTANSKFTITNAGNVLIGTTTDFGVRLAVNGNAHITNSDARLRGGDVGGRFVFGNSDTTSYLITNGSSNGNSINIVTNSFITFQSGPSYTEAMRITSGGDMIFQGVSSSKIQLFRAYSGDPANVGLALYNTAGTTVVSLNGNGGGIYTASLGTGLVYSNGGTLTSTNPSDERLKDNIENIGWGLEEILKLRPVSYTWKNDTINQGTQFGFIAQEVEEVMPEAVKEFGEEEKFLGLEKEAIYVTLIKAIQELKTEIDSLKNQMQ